MRNRVVPFIILLLLVLIFNNRMALAHSPIEKMSPHAGDILEKAPAQIELWFEDPVEVFKGSIVVNNEQNENVPIDKPNVDTGDKRHVTAMLPNLLTPGKYSVKIEAISYDGHQVKENYQFEVKKSVVSQEELFQKFTLEKSSPEDGTIVSTAPEQIELWFSDRTNLTAFGLFDDQDKVVQTIEPIQDPSNPAHFTVKLDHPLDQGTYSVLWFATVGNYEKNGKFYFAVKEFTPIKGSNSITKDSIWSHIGLLQLAHWLAFLGLLAIAGGMMFEMCIAKGRGDVSRWRKASKFLFGISALGFAAELVGYRILYSHVPLNEFITFSFVWIPIIQLIILAIGFWIRNGFLRLVFFEIAVLLWAFTGHSSTPSYGGTWSVVLDGFHLFGVSVWLGGLISLLLMLPKENSTEWLKDVGKTYSVWALGSTFIIAITGVWMSKNYVPAFSIETFLSSDWGKLVVVKMVLFIEILLIGIFQMGYLKRLSSRALRFTKQLKIEVYIGVIILIVAAILIDLSPKEAEQGVYPTSSVVNGVTANVKITPLKMGTNDIVIHFENQPEFKQVRVKLIMPPDWMIDNRAFSLGNGEYHITGDLLHAAGVVQMEVIAVTSQDQKWMFPFEIRVPGVMVQK